MFRVGRDGLDTLLDFEDLPPDALVWLLFGEIDIRLHVPRQMAAQGKSHEVILDGLVKAYIRAALQLARTHRVGILSPVPPVQPGPGLGDTPFADRRTYATYLRERLRDASVENGLLFFDLDLPNQGPDGSLRESLRDVDHGGVHVQESSAYAWVFVEVCRREGFEPADDVPRIDNFVRKDETQLMLPLRLYRPPV